MIQQKQAAAAYLHRGRRNITCGSLEQRRNPRGIQSGNGSSSSSSSSSSPRMFKNDIHSLFFFQQEELKKPNDFRRGSSTVTNWNRLWKGHLSTSDFEPRLLLQTRVRSLSGPRGAEKKTYARLNKECIQTHTYLRLYGTTYR